MNQTNLTIVLMFLAIGAYAVWPLPPDPVEAGATSVYFRLLSLIGIEIALLGGWMLKRSS